jgi:hypothetical protein
LLPGTKGDEVFQENEIDDGCVNPAPPYLSLPLMRPSLLRNSFIMAVRAFFDGSGTPDDIFQKHVVLACRSGPATLWNIVEPRWDSVLSKHFEGKKLPLENGVAVRPYSHMKEAMHLRGLFSRENGWDESKIDNLVLDLDSVLYGYGPSNLVSVVASLDKAQYQEAKSKKKNPMKMATVLTVACCNRIFPSLAQDLSDNNSTINIFFDKGEKFLGDLISDWNNKKICDEQPGLKRINSITQVADMKKTPGLQMADLLGWLAYRCLTADDERAMDLSNFVFRGAEIYRVEYE